MPYTDKSGRYLEVEAGPMLRIGHALLVVALLLAGLTVWDLQYNEGDVTHEAVRLVTGARWREPEGE